jgi:hypothetical protein
MSSSASGPSRTGKPRGRKPGAKVPCDDCIARASRQQNQNAPLELCARCTQVLSRSRPREEQPRVTQKIRPQSHVILDTVLGAQTGPQALPWSDKAQEQQALQFFVQNTATHLVEHFSSPFWLRMVLQAGQYNTSVKQAMAAIGALHERTMPGSSNPAPQQDRVIQQLREYCDRVIRRLTQPMGMGSGPNLQLLLTACVLFCCFSAIQNQSDSALQHAEKAYQLLLDHASDPEESMFDAGLLTTDLDPLYLFAQHLQTNSAEEGFGTVL